MGRNLVAGLVAVAVCLFGVARVEAAPTSVAAAAQLRGVPAAPDTPAADSVALDCSQSNVRITITVSAHLDPSCDWTAGFRIEASDVVFDCQGALITSPGGGWGIEIASAEQTSMNNVVVRNCRIEGFLNSLKITRDGFRTMESGDEYIHELADVTIEHSEFRNSRGVGVYVDAYVSRVTIESNIISGAGSTGIYLETGSRRNLVVDNDIIDNGFRENGPGGQLVELGGQQFRFWGSGREGLAVDGSYENVVRGNYFAGNSAGGVFLYTNCGEFPEAARYFERRFPADDNLIEQNTFDGGINGVWVGQRMAENVYPMECTNEPYLTGLFTFYTLDRAENNRIERNSFRDVVYGVRVEADGTRVIGNTFTAPSPDHHAVIVGTPVRTAELDWPVRNTIVVGNEAAIVDNPNPFRWIHGYESMLVLLNKSFGRPVGLCEGVDPPRLGLIWVIAAVLEPVGSPVTPTPPGLAMPVLGAIDSCPVKLVPKVVPGAVSAGEGADVVQVPVSLSGPSDETVIVTWSTVNVPDLPGQADPVSDYEAASGLVFFEPGQVDSSIEVVIVADAEVEDPELLVVAFGNPVNATMGGFWGLGLVGISDAG